MRLKLLFALLLVLPYNQTINLTANDSIVWILEVDDILEMIHNGTIKIDGGFTTIPIGDKQTPLMEILPVGRDQNSLLDSGRVQPG